MKILKSLPAKLLIGIGIGIIIGLDVPASVMTVLVPVKNIMGQVINFIVPLIVIGFIAPSITKLGSSASRMLGVALIIAYASSVLAALLSMVAGYVLIPIMNTAKEAAGKEVKATLGIAANETLDDLAKAASDCLAAANLALACGLGADFKQLKMQEYAAKIQEWRKIKLKRSKTLTVCR